MPVVNEAIEHVLGYEDFVRNVEIGAAMGTAALAGAGVNVSLWLHRVKHGGVQMHEKAKSVFRKTNFMLTGMSQYDWNTHLVHHPYGDVEDYEACAQWNDTRPEGAPEASIEVFRDPYSVLLENLGGITTKEQLRAANAGEDFGELTTGGLKKGYREVFYKTPKLHRKSKVVLNPFLYDLEAYDKQHGLTTRDHWPAHLRRVDMTEGDANAIRNKYPWLGLVALGVTEGVVFGAPAVIAAMAIHVGGLMKIGGFINSPAHLGEGKGFKARRNVWSGKKLPELNDQDELATTIMPKASVVFMGENNHDKHHNTPEYPYLGGSKIYKDVPGWIIYQLQKRGWAVTPGAPNGPHDRKPKQPKPFAELSARQQAKRAKIEARKSSISQKLA